MYLDLGKVPWWRLAMLIVLAFSGFIVARILVVATIAAADWPNDHTMPTSEAVVLLCCLSIFLGVSAQYIVSIRDTDFKSFVVENGRKRALSYGEFVPESVDQPGVAKNQDDFGLRTIAYLDAVTRDEVSNQNALLFIEELADVHAARPHPRRGTAVALAVISIFVAILAVASMAWFTWEGKPLESAAAFASRTAVVVAIMATVITQVRATSKLGRQMRGQLMEATKAVMDEDMQALRAAVESMRAIHPVPRSFRINTRSVASFVVLGLVAYVLFKTFKPQLAVPIAKDGRKLRTKTRAYVEDNVVVGGDGKVIDDDTLMKFNVKSALNEPRLTRVSLIAELNRMRPPDDAVAVGHIMSIFISLLVIILTFGQIGSIA